MVWVPFPFVEAPRFRNRPALIVSRSFDGGDFSLYWAMMVTSLANAGWPDDIDLGSAYGDIGLSSPCVIRPAKIVSIMEEAATLIGRLPAPLLGQVRAAMDGALRA